MAAHDSRHQRVEALNEFTSGMIVICQRSLDQRATIRIIHVFEIASTLLIVTAGRTRRLQEYLNPNIQYRNKHESLEPGCAPRVF